MIAPVRALLDQHPLPPADGPKDARGQLLLVAGSASCPGAALLSATAALRAGAGRVQLVTAPANVASLGIAVPETLVLGWDGCGAPPDAVLERARDADVVCIGPGLGDEAEPLALALTREIADTSVVVLDAGALSALDVVSAAHCCVAIPNLHEARELLHVDDDGDVVRLARAVACRTGRPAVVRGETTVVHDGASAWREAAVTGLGTPGSGDVFAGLAAAFLSRGLPPTPALGWAVAVHADAGRALARGRPNPGILARDVVDAIPDAIARLPSCGGDPR